MFNRNIKKEMSDMFGTFTYCNPIRIHFGKESMNALADATLVMKGGYHELSREEIIEVFRESL